MHRNKILFHAQNVTLTLALLAGCIGVAVGPALSQGEKQKTPAPTQSSAPAQAKQKYQEDVILLMPNAPSDEDKQELADTLREVKGTVISTLGQGDLQVLVVQTEKGKLAEVEQKLSKDKHVKSMSRNYVYSAQFIPNDPEFANEWHLGTTSCPRAWDTARGGGFDIAIFDSGCQSTNVDLAGKTLPGYNALTLGLVGDARTDVHGHGTVVATTAAATMNNALRTAGVAPNSRVYPVQIAGSDGSTTDVQIIAGMIDVINKNKKIVNISYGAPPPFGFTNALLHAPLHEYFRYFHDQKGGLVFISSGNDGAFDSAPRRTYLNVIGAVNTSLQKASFSNFGNSLTFTAPGTAIRCSNRFNSAVFVQGTSFSSPIVASIAALAWSANPGLSNTRIESILRQSCVMPPSGSGIYNTTFGFGIPNAATATRLARGL
jgi:thermitase